MIILLLLYAFTACQSNKSGQLEGLKTYKSTNLILDSIIFRTSSDQTVYIGTRVLPKPDISDSAAANYLDGSEISSIIAVGDSLFVFLNNDMLVNGVNKNFPQINDSLLRYQYPKDYDVKIDNDIPYIAYLQSEKDYLELIKSKKSGEFYWEGAVIGDTVLSFMNGIKIGTSKDDFFEKLNMKDINSDKSNLTTILYHASVPSDIWYKPYMNSLRSYEHSTTPILFRIKNNSVERILIFPSLGFWNPGENLLSRFNQN